MSMLKNYLYIQPIHTKGRGIFTNENIPPNIVIEEAPVIVMPATDRILLDKTLLHDYIFEWGDDKKKCCVALGMVSLYNHSYASNCEYFMDFNSETIQIKTIRKITKGEELTINYNGDWNDQKRVWFNAG